MTAGDLDSLAGPTADGITYRGIVRAGTRPSTVAILAFALLVAGCSRSSDTSTTTTSASTPTPSSTTTSSTTSSTSSSTTTTTLAEGTVGDPALLAQKIAEGSIGLDLQFGVDPGEVPIPDLTNPDPLVAMSELLLFDIWVFSNAPRSGLVDVYTVNLSPSWQAIQAAAERMNSGRFDFAEGDGLSISAVGYADEGQLSLVPVDVLEEAPDGSVVLYYVYSADPFNILDRDGLIRESNPGWSDYEVVAVVSPSERGWLLFWEERV